MFKRKLIIRNRIANVGYVKTETVSHKIANEHKRSTKLGTTDWVI